ncbi:hypothetical protein [Mycobacteroides salmoniphilum]|uniref:DUF8174 domain-containing protein n=1 Tax=Mycobacteroides salmoniphilum TaxID=404941 RepID=A0A4R8SUA5_9MYCO|nr:hypothetical protein [Mycobacteroides salmoniphilum]TDZ93448.1 hypothetical protein CCUG62472_02825 [Mycobacteroides salmoniphilum]TEA04065.1 hypothetical protein CCUG60884_02928 [Mycobacteroides salmoniphilum]
MAEPGYSTVPYPGLPPMPPPVDYPERKRKLPAWLAPAVVVAALVVLALLLGLLTKNSGVSHRPSEAKIEQTIQGYLDAMAKLDIVTLARNAGCGLYDAVRDKDTDDTIVRANAQQFVATFGTATVKSIDKIVYFSEYQLKVLFTATSHKRKDAPQGQAELLINEGKIYVCSAYMRGANAF